MTFSALPLGTELLAAFFVQSTMLLGLGLLLSACLRWNAAVRHTVLLGTLLSILALPTAGILCRYHGLSIFPSFASNVDPHSHEQGSGAPPQPPLDSGMIAASPVNVAAPTMAAPTTVAPKLAADSGDLIPLPPRSQQDVRWLATAILSGWLVGIAILALRYVVSAVRLASIRRRSVPSTAPVVSKLRAEVASKLGMRAPPVRVSEDTVGPAAVGLFRPIILLPSRLLDILSAEQLGDVLTHEFAHVKRRDHLVCVVERIVSTALWPQPLVHVLRHRLSDAREDLCDNYVLRLSEPVRYGRTLLQVGESLSPAFSLGLVPSAGKLEDRISKLLSERRSTMTCSTMLSKCVAGAAALTFAALLALYTPLKAQETATIGDQSAVLEITKDQFRVVDDEGNVISSRKTNGHVTIQAADGNVFITAEPDGKQPELSPGDEAEAKRLKKDYKELLAKQEALQKSLKDIERKLAKLGVPVVKKQGVLYAIQNEGGQSPKASVFSGKPKHVMRYFFHREAKPVAAATPKPTAVPVPRAAPVPPVSPAAPLPPRSPQPVVVPSAPGLPVVPSAPDQSQMEDRLSRLERMIEELVKEKERESGQ